MPYPIVTHEIATVAAMQTGKSIARFGDGELRVARGGNCVSQVADKRLAAELREILRSADPNLIVGIPNIESATPKAANWRDYASRNYVALYDMAKVYGSAFITRPDSAPWIDTPDYWASVRGLWEGRAVIFVAGTDRSLRDVDFEGASSFVRVDVPGRDAWGFVDNAEAQIMALAEVASNAGEKPLVILCAGCAATVLAARLSRRGVQALDLGHMGMFMRRAGTYALGLDDLASPEYRAQLRAKHESIAWGKHGHSHADEVVAYARKLGASSILDYGCGRGTLRQAVKGWKVQEYDPGIPGKDIPPKPADFVACTDVLEHIEPDRLDAVLGHIYRLAEKGGYFVISCRLAREILPDGRNAHLIVQPPEWWLAQLARVGFKVERSEERKGLCVWVRK